MPRSCSRRWPMSRCARRASTWRRNCSAPNSSPPTASSPGTTTGTAATTCSATASSSRRWAPRWGRPSSAASPPSPPPGSSACWSAATTAPAPAWRRSGSGRGRSRCCSAAGSPSPSASRSAWRRCWRWTATARCWRCRWPLATSCASPVAGFFLLLIGAALFLSRRAPPGCRLRRLRRRSDRGHGPRLPDRRARAVRPLQPARVARRHPARLLRPARA